DNCIPCNHSTLRALFAPQFISRLNIYYRTVLNQTLGNQFREVSLRCWIENAGPATAIELFVLCEPPRSVASPQFNHILWEESGSGPAGLALIARRSIHPEEKIHLCTTPLGMITSQGVKTFAEQSFTFKFSISARNQSPT